MMRSGNKAFVHNKLAVIAWGVAYFLYPTPGVVAEMGHLLIAISSAFAIFGSACGIIGLFMSESIQLKKRHQGLIIEFSGLFLALCGPLCYLITIVYLSHEHHNKQGIPFCLIAYALCAALLSRMVTVYRDMRKAANGQA